MAILGLLAEGPKYGYQIEQDIAARGMRDWTEIGFSSIYYVVNKLEGVGWLGSRQVGGEQEPSSEVSRTDRRSGPARKVYRLTETGQERLRNAVRERLAHPRLHTSDFELALANLPVLSTDEARVALETYQTFLQERLAHIRNKWRMDRAAAEQANFPFPPHVDALFDHSIALIKAEIEWVGKYLRSPDVYP
jgi:DNA-binding PadR family transcriptional regulator